MIHTMGLFGENSERLLAVNNFSKEASSKLYLGRINRVVNRTKNFQFNPFNIKFHSMLYESIINITRLLT